MSAWDLFEDGFPHSTPEGYARGCRGSSCPGIQEFGWSCTFALQQSRGDYHWRRWFEEGRTPAEIVELRKAEEQIAKAFDVPVEVVSSPAPALVEAPKPRPVDEHRWRVTRKGRGVWQAIGGGKRRARRFSSHAEAVAFAVEQAGTDRRIRELHAAGTSDGRIAAQLGLHQRTATERRTALGLPTLFRGRGRVSS